MKKTPAFAWNRSRVLNGLAFLLIVLACCCKAFCGEIQDAARDGNLQKVESLVQQNASLVSSKDDDGKTPLHWAAANGHADVVKFLLQNKADPHAKDNDGDTPFDLASFNKDVAELLRENGGESSSSTHDPAIFEAIRAGDLSKVKAMVEADPGEVSNVDDTYRATPLDMAVMLGQTKIVEYLLDHNSDINAKNVQNETPLMDAAYGGFKDIVTLLLNRGADVNAVNTIATLKDPTHGWTALHFAAAKGYNEIADLLLAAKVDFNVRNEFGWTALHYAAEELWGSPEKGYVDVVQSILAKGADVNAATNSGETPLHLAAQHGRIAMAEFLIAHGANVNAMDKKGRTPLHVAMDQGVKGRDIAAILSKNGAAY